MMDDGGGTEKQIETTETNRALSSTFHYPWLVTQCLLSRNCHLAAFYGHACVVAIHFPVLSVMLCFRPD